MCSGGEVIMNVESMPAVQPTLLMLFSPGTLLFLVLLTVCANC